MIVNGGVYFRQNHIYTLGEVKERHKHKNKVKREMKRERVKGESLRGGQKD